MRVALLLGELVGPLVEIALKHLDAECRYAGSERELTTLLATFGAEVVVADIDRFERAPEWTGRADGGRIPCIGLTRRREARVKIEAFDRGIADVIEVPFTADEIVVRTAHAVAWRRDGAPRPRIVPRVRAGRFEIDLLDGGVKLDGRAIPLSTLQSTLLYLFLAHPGRVLDRESILMNVWGRETAVTSNVVDRHIRDLRVKLGESWRQPSFIETVPGEGYRFIGADTEDALIAS